MLKKTNNLNMRILDKIVELSWWLNPVFLLVELFTFLKCSIKMNKYK